MLVANGNGTPLYWIAVDGTRRPPEPAPPRDEWASNMRQPSDHEALENPMLAELPPAIRKVVEAAQRLDRENLADMHEHVHVCDRNSDTALRGALWHAGQRALSQALAEAGLTLPDAG